MIQYARSHEQLVESLDLLKSRVKAFWNWDEHPVMEIRIEPAKETRSIAQNKLFWEWMEELSTYFTKNGHYLTKDQAHDLMCHTFLGYEDYTLGKTHIRRMKTTTRPKLSVAEFSHFLEQIDAWAADKGCLLPSPADMEYDRYLKTQGRRQ